ncbi:Alpha/Beta hydrolase protein [Syncephalis pseudoplumigaleata]|uniref:Alpha/Beta hydrolase protein n=1 Tax=Syncephalis pseudoplumigaleata TaxID=1712513 RepID=A0A4P9Z5H4_9FUNG|nr:Alpha/Beta hydrolase protein [Syncephalis pseudoplumigaleata]|eukprot:RKP27884.1 Alpha/Beta hydrolase protein [Syncephalis pseudoplumigaleata]
MDQFIITRHIVPAAGEEGLKLSVNVYTPRLAPPTIDVLLAHANGYHKELWHPVIEHLASAHARFIAYDIRNQGDSAALNMDKIGKDDFLWTQNVADMQSIIRHLGLRKPLLGVGHSIGGACVLALEEDRPGTFERIISIDPVCNPFPMDDPAYKEIAGAIVGRSAKRRAQWRSREEARESFLKRAFFKVWDKQVLALHLEHGLKEHPVTGEVMLKCTPEQEVNTFMGNNVSKKAHDGLPTIACPVLFIGGLDSEYNPPGNTENNAERCKHGRVVMLEGVGHLVPMEKPTLVGK